MRPAFLLAFALVAPVALAAGSCAPSCDVPTTTAAYVTPVTVVKSGSTVTWSSLDIAHTSTEDAASPRCFNAVFGDLPASASFRLAGGVVLATSNGVERACHGTSLLPDGTAAVRYFCLFHAGMRAVLVVTP